MAISPEKTFEGLTKTREHELTLRWVRISIFIGIHSALASYVFTQLKVGTLPYMLISVLGILLGFFWAFVLQRTRQYADYWIGRLEALEKIEPHIIPIFRGDDYDALRGGIRTNFFLYNVAVYGIAVGWFVATLISLIVFLITEGS